MLGETVSVKSSQHCEAQEAQILMNRREATPTYSEVCGPLCSQVEDPVLMPGPGSEKES